MTSPKTVLEIPTKTYDNSLSENIGKRQNKSPMFNDHEIEVDYDILTILDSITVIRNPVFGN